ncbi:MAG: alpha/beta hydrolase [Gammaproteobacteria bacterium]
MNTYLTDGHGNKLAYCKTEGEGPGVVFLGGFCSDMSGTKATYLEACCRAWGRAFVRFDYYGHGKSDGEVVKGTMGRWLSDALQVIGELTTGPQILVGSSMGGWLMLLAALARPDRVHGLVGIAAAPDFTEDFSRLSDDHRDSLAKTGVCYIPSGIEGRPYPISAELIAEAKHHYLLHGDIAIHCPIRLLQGMKDADVPWKKAIRIAERVASNDVSITLIKDGDHRLSSPSQLQLLAQTIESLC